MLRPFASLCCVQRLSSPSDSFSNVLQICTFLSIAQVRNSAFNAFTPALSQEMQIFYLVKSSLGMSVMFLWQSAWSEELNSRTHNYSVKPEMDVFISMLLDCTTLDVGMDGWVDGLVSGWMSRWVSGWMDGWMDEWMDGWMGGWVDEWMDRWVDEWMDGWVDGWMDWWIKIQK